MARLTVVEVPDNGGGLNQYNQADKVNNNEAREPSRNIRTQAETFSPRKGYTRVGDLKTGALGVSHLSVYRRDVDADDRLIMVYNNKIFKLDPDTETTWTEIAQSFLTNGDYVNSTGAYGWFFVFNGVNKPLRVANTTVTQPFVPPDTMTGSPENFVPAFGEIYKGSMFVAGVPTTPNVVYISKASTTTDPDNIYDFSGASSGLGDADQLLFKDRVTAIILLNSALVIFTATETYYIGDLSEKGSALFFDPQPIPGAGGTVNQRSAVVVDNDVIYMTPEREIRSVKRALANQSTSNTVSMSIKIQPFLKDQVDADLSDVFFLYNSPEKELYIHLKERGNTVNTLRIIGDITKQDQVGTPEWLIDDNMPFSTGCVFRGVTYAGSCVEGRIYKINDGYADDNSAAIITKRVSKDWTANSPMTNKTFYGLEFLVYVGVNSTPSISTFVDDVLVGTKVLNGATVPGANPDGGGIGTKSIGDFTIGDDGEDEDVQNNDQTMTKAWVRIPIRRAGKVLRWEIDTNGINQVYRVCHFRYFYAAKKTQFVSSQEKI